MNALLAQLRPDALSHRGTQSQLEAADDAHSFICRSLRSLTGAVAFDLQLAPPLRVKPQQNSLTQKLSQKRKKNSLFAKIQRIQNYSGTFCILCTIQLSSGKKLLAELI